jgi:hypothetical protein
MADIGNIINSLKGISGSGNVFAQAIKLVKDANLTLEPGDFARSNMPAPMAAPIASDLWYLFGHNNFLAKYNSGIEGFNGDTYDYKPYLINELSFLDKLTGVKPLKVLRNLDQFAIVDKYAGYFNFKTEYAANGIYWVALMAFELINKDISFKYDSAAPTMYEKNDFVGYITFPVGQLGVMEVISLIQENDLSGYIFAGGEVPSVGGYEPQPADEIETDEIPVVDEPTFFPRQSQDGMCYGDHLIEKSYLVADEQLELLSARMDDPVWGVPYEEDVKPKMWMRYWIHKNDFIPVPGDFVGILCKPISVPSHLWWFQESTPFLYAGNWMETRTLTSGIITEITLEKDRTDGVNENVGDLYFIKIQGCEVAVLSSDFFKYAVGEKVAIVKIDGVAVNPATTSFSWLDQFTFKDALKVKEGQYNVMENYVIIPATFYIKK